MIDVHSGPRERSFFRGLIAYGGGAITVECIVRHLSEKGAKLDVPGSVTLPTEFTLEIPRKAMFKQVRELAPRAGIWRRVRRLRAHIDARHVDCLAAKARAITL